MIKNIKMFNRQIFILAVCYLISTTQAQSCGETNVLNDPVGNITYKAGELYQANERCVWTVRIKNGDAINFQIIQSGISSTNPIDGISIATFTRWNPPLLENELIKEEGTNITMAGTVAIITFVSDSGSKNNSSGFILKYKAIGINNGNISTESVDYISNSTPGNISHPLLGGDYLNDEFSTFVIPPPAFSLDSSPKTSVTWVSQGLPRPCVDQVFVFKFYTGSPSFGGGWSLHDVYCPTSPKTTTHTDSLLYAFETDQDITDKGWRLRWEEV